jgi:hypothetical protein
VFPTNRTHRPLYRANELIPCTGCKHQVGRVARGTCVIARTITHEGEASPGSLVHRCRSCRTLTEVRPEPAAVAA